ncbi:MAG TPA: hypothetical protein VFM55_09415 [Micromonosporaceae bacterium]|nr:hypothetical protein [Micromonosporaceae bacterium]
MTKSEKGATFVAVSLAVSLVVGVCAAVRWAGSSAVALLVTTAFLTTVMVVLSGWVAYRTWKAHDQPSPAPPAATGPALVPVPDGTTEMPPLETPDPAPTQRSVTWYCMYPTSSYIEWNVAGYQTFTATLGIADDTSDAFGAIASMTFYDEDGRQLTKPIDVRMGHPQPVRIPLAGVVHLRLTCSGRDARTNETRGFRSSLGDPAIFNG